MSLHLVPITYKAAADFVADWHRHNRPPPGWKFGVGCADDEGVLHGVAIVGRPVARAYDDGLTLEVTRVATDGTKNAGSMLYAACARACFALGYQRLVTYTRDDESGATMRAASWRILAQRPARRGWDTPARRRDNDTYTPSGRTLWETSA